MRCKAFVLSALVRPLVHWAATACAAFAEALGGEPRLKSLTALGNRITAAGAYTLLNRIPDQPSDFTSLQLDLQSACTGPTRQRELGPPGQSLICGARVVLNLAVHDDWAQALGMLQARQRELKGQHDEVMVLSAAYNGTEVDLLRDAATGSWLSDLPQSGTLAVSLQRLPSGCGAAGAGGVLPPRSFDFISAMVKRKDISDYDRLRWIKVGTWLGCWTVPQASAVLGAFESHAARVQACITLAMNVTPPWGLVDLLSPLSVREVGEVVELLGQVLFCHPTNVTSVYRLKLTRDRDRHIFERLALQMAPAQPESGTGNVGSQLLVRDVRVDGHRVRAFPTTMLAPSVVAQVGDGDAVAHLSDEPAYHSGTLEFVCVSVRCAAATAAAGSAAQLSSEQCAALVADWTTERTCCSSGKCTYESGLLNYMAAEKASVRCLLWPCVFPCRPRVASH